MHKIDIIKTGPDSFTVETWLANGYVDKTRCTSEDQARTFARGIVAGFQLARHAVSPDIRLNTNIIER